MMPVLAAAAAAVFLLFAGAVLLYGVTNIIAGGFFIFALGALLAGISLSVMLSSVANLMLVTLATYDIGLSPPALFVRSILAALTQPTLTGIIALSLVALIAIAAVKIRVMVEEMDILIRTHASLAAQGGGAAQS